MILKESLVCDADVVLEVKIIKNKLGNGKFAISEIARDNFDVITDLEQGVYYLKKK